MPIELHHLVTDVREPIDRHRVEQLDELFDRREVDYMWELVEVRERQPVAHAFFGEVVVRVEIWWATI